MLKLDTAGKKVTFWGLLLGVAGGFTTVGNPVIMWEELRPWMSEIERIEMHDRGCENALARIQTDLFRAQANQAEATERLESAESTESRALNQKMIRQSLEAQQTFAEEYTIEKKECGF